MMEKLYRKVKCPDCCWSEFTGYEGTVGMTPCDRCGSTGYIYELVELEPDEGRLLTGDKMLSVLRELKFRQQNITDEPVTRAQQDESLCEAQDAKTASIIRAEFNQKYKEWEEATMKAERLIIEGKDAEGQERVKGILGFIEQYKEPHEHMGVIDFVGVPLDEWESFKEGV